MTVRIIRILVVLLVIVAVACGFSLLNQKPLLKATWIWNTHFIVTEQEKIISFAQRHNLNLIYLQLKPKEIPAEHYRTFIRNASAANIRVHALAGAPEWALAKKRQSITQLVQWVHNYNRAAEPEERFSGIHLDIEPYLLATWKTDRDEIVQQWMSNMEHFIVESKLDPTLELGVDLPFWFDQVLTAGQPEPQALSEWMISRVDHVTLMAYRNYADGAGGILDLVETELGQADALGKQIVVGVNIRQSDEGEHVSFHQKGVSDMTEQLSIVEKALVNRPSFAGYAVHDYDSWRMIK